VYEAGCFWQLIDDSRTLGEVGFTSSTAKAQTPATVGLVFRQDGKFQSFFIVIRACLIFILVQSADAMAAVIKQS